MKKFEAFTLAETMIVIVVLGIIATLTIPALVNKQKESVAKTKVRKAMAAYESALNKMIIENDLKSDDTLTAWAGTVADCGNPTQYFKKVQGDGCIFKTSDGIWWDISNIERPVISFKEINADNAATITTNANNANDKTAFVLVGRFGNDGSLRVDDLGYETGHDYEGSLSQVEKLYGFLDKITKSNNGNTSIMRLLTMKCYNDGGCRKFDYDENGNIIAKYWCDSTGNNCDENYFYKFEYDGNTITQYGACNKNSDHCEFYNIYKYDENGNMISNDSCWWNGRDYGCNYYKYENDEKGNQIAFYADCNANYENCGTTYFNKNIYDDNNRLIIKYDGCNSNRENCSYSYIYDYDEKGNMIYEHWSCGSNGNINDCDGGMAKTYDDTGNVTSFRYEDSEGNAQDFDEHFQNTYTEVTVPSTFNKSNYDSIVEWAGEAG